MQSDLHEVILKRLLDVTTHVEQALFTGEDPGTLEKLAVEHRSIVTCLKEAGLSRDPELLDLTKETSDRVRGVIEELERQRGDTRRQMEAIFTRQRLARAYKR